MVKAWISWVVSMLLVFQPSAWAFSKDEQASLNRFFEETQITQREVSLKEFYEKTKKAYPENVRKELKALVDQNPNAKLPKVSVTKVNGTKGEEEVQLQFVQNGQSAILNIVGRDGIFAKIGKEVIRFDDMISVDRAIQGTERAMSPSGRLASDRNPSSIPSANPVILKAKDLMRLDKSSQKKYFKNLRDLLETMEDVQQMALPKKTSAIEKSQIELFVSLFITEAQAASEVGMSCIIGGYESTFQKDPTGKLSCGQGDGSLQRDCPVATDVRCNPIVYGNGKKPLCVMAGYDTTQNCNKAVLSPEYGDIPDLVNSSAEFDKLAAAASSQAATLKANCEKYVNSPDQKFKNKFVDQVRTCAELENRIAVINTWPCSNPAFKSNANYQRLCAANGGGQLPPGPMPPTDGGQLPPGSGDAGLGNGTCDPRMHLMPGDSRVCHPSQSTDSGAGFCVDRTGKRIDQVQGCSCNGVLKPVGEPCGAAGGVIVGGGRGKKKSSFWKRNGKLILGVSAALVGLGAYYYFDKKAQKDWDKQTRPLEPNDPVPSPNVTPTTIPLLLPRPGVS